MITIRVRMDSGAWSEPVTEMVGGSSRERLCAVHEAGLRFPGRVLLAEYGRGSSRVYDEKALATMRKRNGFSAAQAAGKAA